MQSVKAQSLNSTEAFAAIASITPQEAEQPIPAHWLTLRTLAQDHALAAMVGRYLARRVHKVASAHTLDAKSRDLTAFVQWFIAMNRHGDIRGWRCGDTNAFLEELVKRGRAAATVNRMLATLQHFASWVSEQPEAIFDASELPTALAREVRDTTDVPCQKFERNETHRLIKAADDLVMYESGREQRPRRNRAILLLMLHTGLRVSELTALKRDQYDGRYLLNVRRKGQVCTRKTYVSAKARAPLDEYLALERQRDDAEGIYLPLFLGRRRGAFLTRQRVGKLLKHIANHANKDMATDDAARLHIYPHRLRHTFGFRFREHSGSDIDTAAALGHASLKYVARYVAKSDAEKEALFEAL